MKRKKILALMVAVMMCLALIPSYALAVDTVALTVLDATPGDNGHVPSRLVDGNTGTSWGMNWTNGTTTAYAVMKATRQFTAGGYILTTGEDNRSYKNRNPRNWTLYGCNDYDEATKSGGTWTVLDTVKNDSRLENENSKSYEYTFTNEEFYLYYKLEVTANRGDSFLKIGEFELIDASTKPVSFQAVDGKPGNNPQGENYTNLFDGKKSSGNFSKYCVDMGNVYVVARADEPVLVLGYIFTTGNDNQSYKGRNPKTWKLYGSNDYDEETKNGTWSLLHFVENDTELQDENYRSYGYSIENDQLYRYYKFEFLEVQSGTLMQLGEIEFDCSRHAHQWNVTVDNAATCTESGRLERNCTDCGISQTIVRPALGHAWETWEAVEATCTEPGHANQKCTRCDAEQTIELPLLGHTWELDEGEKRSCFDTVALHEHCTVCEAKRTAEYPPTGHTEGEDEKCANCGEHIIQVGDKYYFDLQTAINEAVLSQEVVLLQNIAIENTLYVSSKRTLDLKGKTIKKLNSGRVIKVNGEFTLKDSSEEHTGRLIGGSDENGGGVYVSQEEIFHMQGGTIAECSATNEGGGIYVEPLGVLNLSENAVIENCTAGQSGGGIRNKNSKVTITNGTIRGCKAEEYGGGIYAGGVYGGNLEMTDSTIENCTAAQNGGGGIFADKAIVTLTGCTLTGNNANDYGGGIYATSGSNLTMTGCTVQKNIVQNSGGGIFAGGGNAVLTSCYVEENTANASGGGMATNGATITLEQTEINKNITSGNGGGIYAEKSANILFNSGYIDRNKAKEGGGVYLYEGPVFTMSGESNISYNTAASNGGGVMVADVITWYRKDYTNFTMNGGSIVYNEAVGENGDDGYGGGICGRTKTNIYISGGTVESNQAVNGGGISLLDRASASISGGHFQGNAAKSGNGGGCFINHTSSLKLTGGTISRNTTQKLGAGIYVGGTLEVGENPTVSDNHFILETEEGAEEHQSNIYLPAEKTITVADQGLMAMDRGTGEVKPALYVTAENSGAVITGACTEKSSKYLFSDNEDYVAVYEDGVTKLSLGDHTVTFLLNEDEGDIRTVKAADGHPVREIDGDAWGKDGYSFIGWQLNGEDYDFSKPVTSDLTLTPKWISEETPSVSLSYTKFYVNGLMNEKAKLYLAAYRSDGALIGVYSQMLEYPLNDSFEAVGMDLAGADKLAAFLWDEAMKPLCEKALREF